jgi:hypothetical protein
LEKRTIEKKLEGNKLASCVRPEKG